MSPKGCAPRDARGAAAVEFALVCTLLFPLLLAIVDYGLWFNDSLNARQGVRETARAGVVQRMPLCSGHAAGSLEALRCRVGNEVAAASGTTYARVSVPDGWVRGGRLVVCAMVKVDGISSLTPLPAGRLILARTEMAIEVATPVPAGASAGAASTVSDAAPSGSSWTWC